MRPACGVDMADVIHKQQQCIADLRRWRRLCTALLPSLSMLRADAVNDGASESQPVYVMALMSERLICPATAAPCLQCGSESTMSSKTFKPSTRCTPKMSPVFGVVHGEDVLTTTVGADATRHVGGALW